MATLVFNPVMLTIVLHLTLSYYGAHGSEYGTCNVAAVTGTPPPRRMSRIVDITHAYREDLPVADSSEGLGNPIKLVASMKNGSLYNLSEMKMIVHTGTHVDSPAHFFQEHYEAGFDVDTLDLELLNGPALLVDVPRDTNITAKVMEALHIPRGVQRVLFRTLNTDRRLMWKRDFDTSFVGFMEDGAQWLVENTDIKLVGFDDMDSLYASPDDFKDLKHREKIRGLHLLEIFIRRCHEIGVPCEGWIRKGDPKEAICREVKKIHPDILIVGSRGLGPVQRIFVGTVSEYISKHADCPVLVIKRKVEDTPEDPVDD